MDQKKDPGKEKDHGAFVISDRGTYSERHVYDSIKGKKTHVHRSGTR
jgi:hypothetical protein